MSRGQKEKGEKDFIVSRKNIKTAGESFRESLSTQATLVLNCLSEKGKLRLSGWFSILYIKRKKRLHLNRLIYNGAPLGHGRLPVCVTQMQRSVCQPPTQNALGRALGRIVGHEGGKIGNPKLN